MSQSFLVFALALPVVLPLLLVAWLGLYPQTRWIQAVPWLALPGLLLLILPVGTVADYPWQLLGLQLGIDETNRVFLAMTAVLWLAAGVYAQSYLRADPRYLRYSIFHLLTMAGNFGLVLAQEAVSFYAGFVLMSLAAFGLVVHTGTRIAYRAGLVYLVMAVAGELVLFAGMVLLAAQADSILWVDLQAVTPQPLTLALLVIGFGIKAGLLGLHIWLPLAHPVAPTPASAVLSGVMVKAGVLGWLRFLPLGAVALPGWGGALLVLGLAGAYFAVLRGLPETDPKKILAYSSVSQLGLITSAVGLGLWLPEIWPVLGATVLLYALHHALTKGALFLGVGVCAATAAGSRRAVLVWTGMVLLAGALAGLPFSSGATAKYSLKQAVAMLEPWPATVLLAALGLAAVGTALLMLRLLWQLPFSAERIARPPLGMWLPWAGLLLLAWLLAIAHPLAAATLAASALWAAIWPIGLGLVIGWMTQQPTAQRYWRRLYAEWRWYLGLIHSRWQSRLQQAQYEIERIKTLPWPSRRVQWIEWRRRLLRDAAKVERLLTRWPVLGLALMVLVLLVFVVSGV